jgi:hypothetical protein
MHKEKDSPTIIDFHEGFQFILNHFTPDRLFPRTIMTKKLGYQREVFSKFIDNISKSYWNNNLFPQRYTDVYNKTNQNVTDNTVNATRRVNDVALASAETFNKSIEIAQKYYNEAAQNYLNFVNKIEKSYYNQ